MQNIAYFTQKINLGSKKMKYNVSLGRTRLTGHHGVNKLLMTEILFGTPNSKTKGSLELLLKISTENPDHDVLKWLKNVFYRSKELESEGQGNKDHAAATLTNKDISTMNTLYES